MNFFVPDERYVSDNSVYISTSTSHLPLLNMPHNPSLSAVWLGSNGSATQQVLCRNVESQTVNQNQKKRKLYVNKPAEVITPEQHHLSIKDSPSYFLGLFIDSEVVNWLIDETNRHGESMRNFTPITEDEMRCFVAILFLSGYVDVPRRRMLWERSPDTHCPLVSNAMQRDRFESIFSAIHMTETRKNELINLQQIQPLVYRLNEKFIRYIPSDDQHSLAECTVSVFSKHHNAKATGKSLKMWCGSTKAGYCTWFNPVTPRTSLNTNEECLDAHSVILHYASYIKHCQRGLINLLVENCYLEGRLVDELSKLGIQVSGADREKSSCLLNPPLGGVDKLDCNIGLYRTSMHGKKSYYSTVLNFCLDLALNNAWQLYRMATQDKKPLDLLGFRRNIVVYYLQHYAKPILSRKGGRPAKVKLCGKKAPPSDARYDGIRHYVIPQEKQTRCAKCSAKTTTRCQKCDVGVHVKCFVEYHTRPRS